MEDVAEHAGEQGDRAHRDDRGEATVATGRLPVATRPEAGERQDEGGHAERPKRRDVDDEPAHEAENGSGDRTAQKPEGDDGHEKQIGRTASDDHRRHDDDLHHRRDERDCERAEPGRRAHRGRSFGTSTITASSAPKSTYGST